MNKKQIIITTGALAITGMLFATSTFAQDPGLYTNTGENSDGTVYGTAGDPNQTPPIYYPEQKDKRPLPPIRKDIRDARIEGRAEIRDLRQEKMGELNDTREVNRVEVETMRDDSKSLDPKDRAEANREIRDKILENREAMQEKREEMKSTFKEKREELKNELHQKMQVRFEAMVNRFVRLADRIQSHIDQKVADGKDMTEAQTSLDQAKVSIDELKVMSSVVVIAAGDDQATIDANRAAIEAIKEKAKEVKSELKGTVSLLK